MRSQEQAEWTAFEPRLTGMKLDAARALCGSWSLGATADGGPEPPEIQVLETSPPFLAKGYTPIWGEWRVLRAHLGPNTIKLYVARELLSEVRASGTPRPS